MLGYCMITPLEKELSLIVNNQNIINAGILYDNTFDKKLSLFVKNQNITNAGILYDNTFGKGIIINSK